MSTARPRIDLAPLNIALTIMLAAAAAIQTWNNFNTALTADVAVLKQQVADLRAEVRELRGGNHGGSR